MEEKKTSELLQVLNSINNKDTLNDYINNKINSYDTLTLSDYFDAIFKEKNLKKSDVINSTNLNRTYAYQILNGTKKASRNKILQLCIGAKLNLNETQKALTLGNVGNLYAKNPRDSIIIFSLNKGISVLDVNDLLFQFEEEILDDEI